VNGGFWGVDVSADADEGRASTPLQPARPAVASARAKKKPKNLLPFMMTPAMGVLLQM
jgi:hypothetical protein